MKKVRAAGSTRRRAYAGIVAALACAVVAVPLASGAAKGYPTLIHDQLTVTDATEGDGDNVIEPGESFSMSERIRNVGPSSINTISTYMYSTTGLVSMRSASSSYPDMVPGAVASNATPFVAALSAQATCGLSFELRLSVSSAQGNFLLPVQARVGSVGEMTSRNSTNVPLVIQSPGIVESTLDVPDSGFIGDINVRIGELRHTYDEDLRISLIAPDQTRVVVAEFLGGSGDDYINTVFDDDAPTSITEASPPFTGTFRPQEPLSLLGGRQQAGVWKLQIQDVYPDDGGTLYAWGEDSGLARCNRAPRAGITWEGDIRAKENVTFESSSADPDGSITSQAWDLDNDGAFDDGTDATATWRFPQRGSYTVRLRVVDSGGEAATATEEVAVQKARTIRRVACVVPRLRGKTLRAARRAIRRAHCKVGRVRYARSQRARGKVLSQSPRAGKRKAAGTKVHLVVSRGAGR